MNKIWILFKREYLAAVKTKSFIISLILVPIMMGGSLIVVFLMEDNQDISDRKVLVIDHSGELQEVLTANAEARNTERAQIHPGIHRGRLRKQCSTNAGNLKPDQEQGTACHDRDRERHPDAGRPYRRRFHQILFGAFLHGQHALLARHLIENGRAEQLFPAEPIKGLVARPNCETAQGCSL